MSKLFYIANMRLPSERAHSWQIMRMCLAFANNGEDVELLVPMRKTDHPEDPFQFYGIPSNAFKITRIRSIDLFPFKYIPRAIAYYLHAFSFLVGLIAYIPAMRSALVYSRDPISSFVLGPYITHFGYEIHDAPAKTLLNTMMIRGLPYVVVTNNFKEQLLKNTFGRTRKIHRAHHGVDCEVFSKLLSQDVAKKQLGLDIHKKYIIYTGHLYTWKGVYSLARCAQLFDESTQFLFIGGTESDVVVLRQFLTREHITNVTLCGFKKREDMLRYVACADVLVLPTSAQFSIGNYESSPLKLFEYMATKKPVVVTDIPSIREIVDEEKVFFAEADKPTSLAEAIKEAMNDTSFSRPQHAYEFVLNYSWEQRAQQIINLLRS